MRPVTSTTHASCDSICLHDDVLYLMNNVVYAMSSVCDDVCVVLGLNCADISYSIFRSICVYCVSFCCAEDICTWYCRLVHVHMLAFCLYADVCTSVICLVWSDLRCPEYNCWCIRIAAFYEDGRVMDICLNLYAPAMCVCMYQAISRLKFDPVTDVSVASKIERHMQVMFVITRAVDLRWCHVICLNNFLAAL